MAQNEVGSRSKGRSRAKCETGPGTGVSISHGAAHSVVSQVFLGDFPTIQKPMRSDLARWDELPAQSSVTAAEYGPIHNPGTDRPFSDIAAGLLLLTIQLVSFNQNGWDSVWEKKSESDQEENKLQLQAGLGKQSTGQGLLLKTCPPYSIQLFSIFGKCLTLKLPGKDAMQY